MQKQRYSIYVSLHSEMVNELDGLEIENLSGIEYARRGIEVVKLAIERLRQQVIKNGFADEESEISFFKEMKPQFMSRLIFFRKLYDLEVNRPIPADKLNSVKYFKREIRRIKKHVKKNADLHYYYKSGQTFLDKVYFIRKVNDLMYADGTYMIVDSQFQTQHDSTIAEFIANELYCEYLYEQLALVDASQQQVRLVQREGNKGLRWTGSKTALTELIYALFSAGVINDGNAEVKDIAAELSQLFNIDIGNFYRTFQEIRLRKKDRFSFMNQLIDRLEDRMNYWDENPKQ
ncbi:RteC domain-containing protein [Chitinophaga sp. 212800010-3]|uniref:RteC domain-containing protein n=1 Tax=unclassified Chitinophaga TaxID=2619133 RepID=UPI002DE6C422|nr:RteC protein [Chitinophaga sp. 212800010-3]